MHFLSCHLFSIALYSSNDSLSLCLRQRRFELNQEKSKGPFLGGMETFTSWFSVSPQCEGQVSILSAYGLIFQVQVIGNSDTNSLHSTHLYPILRQVKPKVLHRCKHTSLYLVDEDITQFIPLKSAAAVPTVNYDLLLRELLFRRLFDTKNPLFGVRYSFFGLHAHTLTGFK